MSATVAFDDVIKMLDKCAAGYTIRLANHSRVIKFGGTSYPSLPKFDKIEVGHIKKMARHFGILDCVKKFLGIA
jgi:hypothetical protein